MRYNQVLNTEGHNKTLIFISQNMIQKFPVMLWRVESDHENMLPLKSVFSFPSPNILKKHRVL